MKILELKPDWAAFKVWVCFYLWKCVYEMLILEVLETIFADFAEMLQVNLHYHNFLYGA